jgi:two-component system heavy metal sensor histidine kinase CusS
MFLKNVMKSNLSITARLTLFYGLTTILLTSIIAIFLYSTIVHVLHKANMEFLSHEVKIVSKLVEQKKIPLEILKHKVLDVPETETGSSFRYYIRILNGSNKTFLETNLIENIFQQTVFFKQSLLSVDQEIEHGKSKRGRDFLLIRAPVYHDGKLWQIQIALDISYQQMLLKQWQSNFFVGILFLTLIAIFTGFFIARRGMNSLWELIQKTKALSASSLHQKIDLALWPSELKKLGVAFNDLFDRVEKSFSRLNQFSADLAHELRTPINNIMGQTEIALSKVKSAEEYQNLLGSNLEELQRISEIIENLLFLARAENHEIDLAKTKLRVADEIRLLCDFYQILADEKNIRMILEGDAEIFANSVMFRRAISNLLKNALKYSLENSEIKITIQRDRDHVKIMIQDEGIGIAADHLPHVFTRFYRVDEARSHHSGGTGLGLAIVKSIVELHQGLISISSEVGKGTRVEILL